MGKKIKITIAIVLMVLSIPLCTRWFSTVKYYFSDEGKQATSSLKYRVTGTSTVQVAGFEEGQTEKTIIIPEKAICCGYLFTVTSIRWHAFHGCSGMTSVKIPSSVTKIGWEAFSGCSGLTSVEIPSSVTEISEYAFKGCSSLTNIEIPSSVTEIGDYAFSGCSGLTSVEIPSSVTEIGEHAFEGCSGLTSVEIPSSVTEIGERAFKNCDNLNIVIDNSESNVIVGGDAFEGCKSVTWKKDL